jgi:tRNA/rRNA methyltransferase
MNDTHTLPAIVLVNTQMPENIGAAARAMMNFGLHEMRLVAPREEWPNKRAYDLAGHAAPILDAATLYATTREAVADRERVYAATARGREIVKPVYTPFEASGKMGEEPLPTAILFGPERTGLTNDDVTLADAIITIPTADTLSSLNVAQSVVVVAYQWYARMHGAHGQGAAQNTPFNTTGPLASPIVHKSEFATKEDLATFFDHLERELDAVDFWKVMEKKPKMWLNLRNVFTRANLTEQEVRSLHGVVAALRERK